MKAIDYKSNNYGIIKRKRAAKAAAERKAIMNTIMATLIAMSCISFIIFATIETVKENIIRDIQVTATETGYNVEFWGNIYTYNK